MTLRDRALVSSTVLVLLPLIVLALLIRIHVNRLLERQFSERADLLATSVEADLVGRERYLQGRLAALAIRLADDNHFRQALAAEDLNTSAYLVNYGESIMPLLGLDLLQIRDVSGTVLTSGHFREEYGWRDPAVLRGLRRFDPGPALLAARAPSAPFLTLAALDSLDLGDRRLFLLGGVRVGVDLLSGLAGRGGGAVSLVYPDPGEDFTRAGVLSSDPDLGRQLQQGSSVLADSLLVRLPSDSYQHHSWPTRILPASGERSRRDRPALWVVSQSRTAWLALAHSLDRWLLAVLIASAAGMLALAIWWSLRVTRPLEELARRTQSIDLDHLWIGFETRRDDEVGALARLLAAMTARLRRSAEKLRDAERRATLGEMARQVNHDIRNGLAPIRNVIRHLGQTVRDHPEQAATVLAERQTVLESSVAYLESLADNYARLSSRPQRHPCDLGSIVHEVAAATATPAGVSVRATVAPHLAPVSADPIGLRRIVENLVRNAFESLNEQAGEVRILADNVADEDNQPGVRLVVSDTGPGISPAALNRIFEDFYTTKATGAGLGLSIVRRLVTDFQGTVRAESVAGQGATFTVWMPAAIE